MWSIHHDMGTPLKWSSWITLYNATDNIPMIFIWDFARIWSNKINLVPNFFIQNLFAYLIIVFIGKNYLRRKWFIILLHIIALIKFFNECNFFFSLSGYEFITVEFLAIIENIYQSRSSSCAILYLRLSGRLFNINSSPIVKRSLKYLYLFIDLTINIKFIFTMLIGCNKLWISRFIS